MNHDASADPSGVEEEGQGNIKEYVQAKMTGVANTERMVVPCLVVHLVERLCRRLRALSADTLGSSAREEARIWDSAIVGDVVEHLLVTPVFCSFQLKK